MNAVEKVRQRLHKAAAVLRAAKVPFAVVGGNAVALWVSRVDESAVRTTRDVDVLLRRSNFDAARAALESAGFVYRHAAGIDVFLDSAQARPHDAIHIIYANEKVRPDEPIANPDVNDSEDAGDYPVIGLEALVRIKLTANRDKDRTHLRDMIGVSLIDGSWLPRFPPILADRLRHLLDTPLG